MPPKGWRKNTEGQYPQPNKDQDLVSIDEILFPRATVQKLAKNIISASSDNENASNMIIAKDSLLAIQRSATVFVSHLMFQARQVSKEEGRKTVNAQDILASLEKAEFSGFVPEVKQKLSAFETNIALKKKSKAENRTSATELAINSLNKRLKDNDEQTIQRTANADMDDEPIEDDEDITEDLANDEEANNNVDGDEGQDDPKDDEVLENPIALLSKEEDELKGEEPVEDDEKDDEDEHNSSDDEI